VSAAAKALSIAGTDLRRLYRDRTALFFMLLLPVFIILLIGLAFGSQGSRLRVGVVDPGTGPLSTELEDLLRHSPQLRVQSYGSVSALRAAVRHQEVLAGVVVPLNYDAALATGQSGEVQFVAGAA